MTTWCSAFEAWFCFLAFLQSICNWVSILLKKLLNIYFKCIFYNNYFYSDFDNIRKIWSKPQEKMNKIAFYICWTFFSQRLLQFTRKEYFFLPLPFPLSLSLLLPSFFPSSLFSPPLPPIYQKFCSGQLHNASSTKAFLWLPPTLLIHFEESSHLVLIILNPFLITAALVAPGMKCFVPIILKWSLDVKT